MISPTPKQIKCQCGLTDRGPFCLRMNCRPPGVMPTKKDRQLISREDEVRRAEARQFEADSESTEVGFSELLLPDWCVGTSDVFQVGSQLCTRDGRKMGNACITHNSALEGGGPLFTILTDAGTKVPCLTERELHELFYPPNLLMDPQTCPGARVEGQAVAAAPIGWCGCYGGLSSKAECASCDSWAPRQAAPAAEKLTPDAYNRRLRAQLEQEWCALRGMTRTTTPPADIVRNLQPAIDYAVVQEFASSLRVDYNELCKMVRTALPAQPTSGERIMTATQLSELSEAIEGLDKTQPGYHWRKGWNAALQRAVDCARPVAPQAAPVQGLVAWLAMADAPLDGTLVRLLVKFDNHAIEDTVEPTATIGSHNDGEWNFVGWNWHRDEWTRGSGDLLGWLPMTTAAPQAAPAVSDIDYEALIAAAQKRVGGAQGTPRCVAFKEGAEWYRECLLAAPPREVSDGQFNRGK